jgi:hypothetical protein
MQRWLGFRRWVANLVQRSGHALGRGFESGEGGVLDLVALEDMTERDEEIYIEKKRDGDRAERERERGRERDRERESGKERD